MREPVSRLFAAFPVRDLAVQPEDIGLIIERVMQGKEA